MLNTRDYRPEKAWLADFLPTKDRMKFFMIISLLVYKNTFTVCVCVINVHVTFSTLSRWIIFILFVVLLAPRCTPGG